MCCHHSFSSFKADFSEEEVMLKVSAIQPLDDVQQKPGKPSLTFFSAAPSSDVNPRVRETVHFWNPLACWKVVDGPYHPGRNRWGFTMLRSSHACFLCTSYSSIAARGKVGASAFWILMVWSCVVTLFDEGSCCVQADWGIWCTCVCED